MFIIPILCTWNMNPWYGFYIEISHLIYNAITWNQKEKSIIYHSLTKLSSRACLQVANNFGAPNWLNYRIQGHLFTSHWITKEPIVLFLFLQRLPTRWTSVALYSVVPYCTITIWNNITYISQRAILDKVTKVYISWDKFTKEILKCSWFKCF